MAIGDDIESETPENPIKNSSSDIEHIGAWIPILLTNISKLNKTTSRQFYVEGVKWAIQAEKIIVENTTTLSVYLVADDDDLNTGISLAAKIIFKILPVTGDTYPIVQNQKYHCYWGASKLRLIYIVSNDFYNEYESFIHKNSMNFLINFEAEEESIWDIEM